MNLCLNENQHMAAFMEKVTKNKIAVERKSVLCDVGNLHSGTNSLSYHAHSTQVLIWLQTRKKQLMDGQPVFSPHCGLHCSRLYSHPGESYQL